MSKQHQLLELAKLRQQEIPDGYKGIGEYHQGLYECDHVSPYSKSAGNIDANIMFILQDWCSDHYLSQPIQPETLKYGYAPRLATNKNLKSLLQTHFGLEFSKTYGTNLFPFIKPGNMSAKISRQDLVSAAVKFTIPQINIIQPKLVICLGAEVINSIRRALGMKPSNRLATSIEDPFKFNRVPIWAQSHPGGQGRANRNRGNVDRVRADWESMANAYQNKLRNIEN